ncbi:19457_t:CDS:2, partial [Funneliformis geosporum]
EKIKEIEKKVKDKKKKVRNLEVRIKAVKAKQETIDELEEFAKERIDIKARSNSSTKNHDDDEVDEVEEINKLEFEKSLINNEEENKILGIEIEDDIELDVEDEIDNSEIEEFEDEYMEISFKLIIRREDNRKENDLI